jgi:hypothetical protein
MTARVIASRVARGLSSMTAALALVLCLTRGARADNVDTLIGQLSRGADYKVRLSAALSLAKLGDPRAIPAFVRALGSDGDKTVRGAAAVGLAKLVDGSTEKRLRSQAIAGLDRASQGDSDPFVKKQAQKALLALRSVDDTAQVTAGGIFVDVGPMSAKTSGADALRDVMKKTVRTTFGKRAHDMMLTWPGGSAPSRSQLEAKKVSAYHVDGTLTEVTVKEKGASAVISCKISMLIATYPEKSMFGFLNGGASVQGSSAADDVELAKQDCVVAVVEDLVTKKIIPTIQTRSGQ